MFIEFDFLPRYSERFFKSSILFYIKKSVLIDGCRHSTQLLLPESRKLAGAGNEL